MEDGRQRNQDGGSGARLSKVMETNEWRGGWRNFKMTEGRRARDLGKEEKEGGDIWA